MKFLESHFEEYTNEVCKSNLHPKLEKCYSRFPETLDKLGNLIFYGPSGVGKYSQMLYAIKKYSPTELKYEKKISLTYDKKQYFFKISDIHYEIDMSLLGCNSKLLWHDIYLQIVDALSAKTNKVGIIVCKDFHNIHSELLENFYSYIQDNNSLSVSIKYILLTEEVCFIPDSIINCCEIINIPRPTKLAYTKCSRQKIPNDLKIDNIVNIKYLHTGIYDLMYPHKIICEKIIKEMIEVDDLKFLKFRDLLYDIFIYNLDITDCIWYILTNLIKSKKIKKKNMSEILLKTYSFLKYYNNNYRPIYHLESYLFYLMRMIHGF
jgi:DNA polymerase III delta prime subunit